MRTDTKRAYEKRIAELEERLAKEIERANLKSSKAHMWENEYARLKEARRHGETAREWAIEQAIRANQPNIVQAAAQITDFVYGPDTRYDSEAETG